MQWLCQTWVVSVHSPSPSSSAYIPSPGILAGMVQISLLAQSKHAVVLVLSMLRVHGPLYLLLFIAKSCLIKAGVVLVCRHKNKHLEGSLPVCKLLCPHAWRYVPMSYGGQSTFDVFLVRHSPVVFEAGALPELKLGLLSQGDWPGCPQGSVCLPPLPRTACHQA